MFILFWTRPVQLVFLTFFNKLINVDYEFFILSCTAHEICPELEDRMASAGGFVHARLCVDQTPTSAIAAAISCWSVESWVMWLKQCHKPPMTVFFYITYLWNWEWFIIVLPTFRHLWRVRCILEGLEVSSEAIPWYTASFSNRTHGFTSAPAPAPAMPSRGPWSCWGRSAAHLGLGWTVICWGGPEYSIHSGGLT